MWATPLAFVQVCVTADLTPLGTARFWQLAGAATVAAGDAAEVVGAAAEADADAADGTAVADGATAPADMVAPAVGPGEEEAALAVDTGAGVAAAPAG
jgi:hypothetical protein